MPGRERLGEAVRALLEAQGIAATPERAQRLAAALAPLIEASAADQAEEVPEFAAVLEAERWRR